MSAVEAKPNEVQKREIGEANRKGLPFLLRSIAQDIKMSQCGKGLTCACS
jgi:hypothetical protein